MAFGWAGAGGAAAKGLEEILAQQMIRAQLQQREQEAAQRMQLERDQLAESTRVHDADIKARDQQIDLGERRRRDDNNSKGLELMQRDKNQMDQEAILATLPPKLRQIADMRRVGVTGISPDDLRSPEEIKAADEADVQKQIRIRNATRTPEKPSYINVTGPDGTLMPMTAEEIRAKGGVATTKGNAPDPNKASETREKILSAAKALRAAPGLSNLTGNRILNPDYNLGITSDPRAGSAAANAKPLYDTLKSLMTLDNLGLLKGAMSDKDLLFLQSAGSSLDTKMDDPTFVAELDKIIQKFENVPGAGGASGAVDPRVQALIDKYGKQ